MTDPTKLNDYMNPLISKADYNKALLKAHDKSLLALSTELKAEKTYSSGLEGIIREQKKEIDRMDKAFRDKIKRINTRHDAITYKMEKQIDRYKTIMANLENLYPTEYESIMRSKPEYSKW